MSSFPDFATLPFEGAGDPAPAPVGPLWETPEGIAVKSAYAPANVLLVYSTMLCVYKDVATGGIRGLCQVDILQTPTVTNAKFRK